jgi:hypothetical protein
LPLALTLSLSLWTRSDAPVQPVGQVSQVDSWASTLSLKSFPLIE